MEANTEIQNQLEDIYKTKENLIFFANPVVILLGVVAVIFIIIVLSFSSSSPETSSQNTTLSPLLNSQNTMLFGSPSSQNMDMGVGVGMGMDVGGITNNQTSGKKGVMNNIFIGLAIIVILVMVVFNAVQYFWGINITTYIHDIFSGDTKINIDVSNVYNEEKQDSASSPIPEIKSRPQVFNVYGNNYSYDEARAVCSAYGASLATYDQVEEAYNNGANWASFGWSDGQMALYPIQKEYYNHLQTIPGHEHDVSRPGINGGYIANPNVKFGANCFGYKPKIDQEEIEIMETIPEYPKTKKDVEFEKQVAIYKSKIDEIVVSPFNTSKWSEF